MKVLIFKDIRYNTFEVFEQESPARDYIGEYTEAEVNDRIKNKKWRF